MAAALFVMGYNTKYSHCVSMEEFSVLPMLHFTARKFASQEFPQKFAQMKGLIVLIKGPIFLIIVYEPSFSLFIAFYMSFLRFLI